ncbi:flagellar biosynthetic protein FliO [Sphingobium sp. BYY-5]|uniref:flagellar biosynthetic protein FliO n=1 Tax=Sphingobium sp. BYY-5 TaxID=2926400 RepID=UPI001FA793A6|nr:flagellar biosynthetic protein FliO [Sphingobium sp. BYY-5]MCI4592621.1 flagellar biosynthetic protein FliO [Sphingobium sp. BYY-5]
MNAGTFFLSLLAVVLALAVVLGLAWVVLRLLRRWNDHFQGGEANEQPIRFLRAMAVGQRERIALVEVRGEVMLIGVTGGGISLLARWPEGRAAPVLREPRQP